MFMLSLCFHLKIKRRRGLVKHKARAYAKQFLFSTKRFVDQRFPETDNFPSLDSILKLKLEKFKEENIKIKFIIETGEYWIKLYYVKCENELEKMDDELFKTFKTKFLTVNSFSESLVMKFRNILIEIFFNLKILLNTDFSKILFFKLL